MPAMLTAFAWVKEEVLLSFPRLGSPNPGVIPSYPAAQRRPLRRNTCPLFDSLLSQDPLDQSVRSRIFDKRYFAARK
jgi:hypothetical protein